MQIMFSYHLQVNCLVKGIDPQRTILCLLHKSITPMASYLFLNNILPEFVELLATRPITIHDFHSNVMDCLDKTFFGLILNLKC